MAEGTGTDPVDWYEILGVDSTANSDEIKTAYRTLVKRTHPDAGGNAALFRLVEQAYATLSEPGRRAEYDHDRTRKTRASQPADENSTDRSGRADPHHTATAPPGFEDLHQILLDLAAQASYASQTGTPAAERTQGPGAEQNGEPSPRIVTVLRAHVIAFSLAAGLLWHLSRVTGLPRRFGGESSMIDGFERVFGGAFTPALVLVVAAATAGVLLWQDRWALIGRLPGSAPRWALSCGLLAAGAVCETATSPGALVLVAAGTIAGYGIGSWRSRRGAGAWSIRSS